MVALNHIRCLKKALLFNHIANHILFNYVALLFNHIRKIRSLRIAVIK